MIDEECLRKMEECLGQLVRLREIPEIFGVTDVTVKQWRSLSLRPGNSDAENALPDPLQFPEQLARVVAVPLWDRDVLIRWGIKTGRLDSDGKPKRRHGSGPKWRIRSGRRR